MSHFHAISNNLALVTARHDWDFIIRPLTYLIGLIVVNYHGTIAYDLYFIIIRHDLNRDTKPNI